MYFITLNLVSTSMLFLVHVYWYSEIVSMTFETLNEKVPFMQK